MPDLLVAIEFADGSFVEGSAAFWPRAFPRKQPKRVQVRRPRGPFSWALHSHAVFGLWGTEPLVAFDVDVDPHAGRVWGERYEFRGGEDPVVTAIDLRIDDDSLPSRSAFIPAGAFVASPGRDPARSFVGNFPKSLWRRLRARRRR